MIQAHQRTAAIKAAIELDIFSAIGKGNNDVGSLARCVNASERGVRVLCDFLCINEILDKKDANYYHTPTSAAFLDPASPACLASIANFLASPDIEGVFNQLATIVRAGRTILPGTGSVEPENPLWVAFARNMAPMMGPAAGPLAAVVLEGRTGPIQVLDIAAGHGLFGIEIAKQNPEAEITGLDWTPVLNVALENAEKAGVDSRYNMLPGSAFDVDYAGPYDAILLTNFLHHFDKPTNVGLLKKVRAALKPGGCAATLEFVPNEDRISPPMAAGFSLTMLTTTASGDAYTYPELHAMYAEAGFEKISKHPIPMSPQTVVMGIA
jgi:ubiquinone/menaquinone biosynthesis C-methylase UbiE